MDDGKKIIYRKTIDISDSPFYYVVGKDRKLVEGSIHRAVWSAIMAGNVIQFVLAGADWNRFLFCFETMDVGDGEQVIFDGDNFYKTVFDKNQPTYIGNRRNESEAGETWVVVNNTGE